SCASAPPPSPAAPQSAPDPQIAFDRGHYAEAARQWQSEALSTTPEKADEMRISAADAWLLANDPSRAEGLLRWINKDALIPSERARLELVQAELALRSGYTPEAAALLSAAQTNLPVESEARFNTLQAQVAAALELESKVDLNQIHDLA